MRHLVQSALVGLAVAAAAAFAVVCWLAGQQLVALLLGAVGVVGAWAWLDNRFVYAGRISSGGSQWRGPSPHEGWSDNAADRDTWLGGGGG
jgi:hypothetical protein